MLAPALKPAWILHHAHLAHTHTASALMHTGDRWAWNHTSNIQAAYFNGDGFVSWENVWGIWQGMTPRDSAALRAVSRVCVARVACVSYCAPPVCAVLTRRTAVAPDPTVLCPGVHGGQLDATHA